MKTIDDFIRESETLREVGFPNLQERKIAANGWFQEIMRFMDREYPDRSEVKEALVDASGYRIREETVPSCLEPPVPLDEEMDKEVEEYRTKLDLIVAILNKLKAEKNSLSPLEPGTA